jgi:D-glycero-alpha-D-manno-heptose 1-phosphate guanylyltransferase
MRILMLAGGFGTRLQPVLSNIPKALAPVRGKPFIYFQLERLMSQGLKSFVFLLHHKSELIIEFLEGERNKLFSGSEFQYLVEPTPLGTGGAISYAVEKLKLQGNFLVTNSDTWLGSGVREILNNSDPAMLIVRSNDSSRYGNVLFNDQKFITQFSEKNEHLGPGWINAGLYLFNSQLFQGWNNKPFSLEKVTLSKLVLDGAFKAVPVSTNFIDIGIPEDYEKFCLWADAGRVGK